MTCSNLISRYLSVIGCDTSVNKYTYLKALNSIKEKDILIITTKVIETAMRYTFFNSLLRQLEPANMWNQHLAEINTTTS